MKLRWQLTRKRSSNQQTWNNLTLRFLKTFFYLDIDNFCSILEFLPQQVNWSWKYVKKMLKTFNSKITSWISKSSSKTYNSVNTKNTLFVRLKKKKDKTQKWWIWKLPIRSSLLLVSRYYLFVFVFSANFAMRFENNNKGITLKIRFTLFNLLYFP